MLRRLGFLVLATALCSIPAHAQSITDKIEAFGGYSFMHFNSSPSFNTNGWEIGGQYKVTRWIGGIVDVDGHYGTFEGVRADLNNYVVGAQANFPAPVSPFAHVFVGGARISATQQTSSSLATGFGFGIDYTVAPQIAWRIIQIDVVHTHLFNQAEGNTRLSTGIVIHF